MAGADWSLWREQIARACDGSHHTIESIEAQIAAGVLTVLTTQRACYLVQVETYPTEIACQIMWAAGELGAVLEDLSHVHAWAILNGCTEMLVEGRPGWERALKPAGYSPWSITLRRPLHGPIQ